MSVPVVEWQGRGHNESSLASYALGRSLFARVAEALKGAAPHHFRPMYAPRHAGAGGANMGHPSREKDFVVDRNVAVGWE